MWEKKKKQYKKHKQQKQQQQQKPLDVITFQTVCMLLLVK